MEGREGLAEEMREKWRERRRNGPHEFQEHDTVKMEKEAEHRMGGKKTKRQGAPVEHEGHGRETGEKGSNHGPGRTLARG